MSTPSSASEKAPVEIRFRIVSVDLRTGGAVKGRSVSVSIPPTSYRMVVLLSANGGSSSKNKNKNKNQGSPGYSQSIMTAPALLTVAVRCWFFTSGISYGLEFGTIGIGVYLVPG